MGVRTPLALLGFPGRLNQVADSHTQLLVVSGPDCKLSAAQVHQRLKLQGPKLNAETSMARGHLISCLTSTITLKNWMVRKNYEDNYRKTLKLNYDHLLWIVSER